MTRRHTPKYTTLLALLAAGSTAVGLSACGITDPYATTRLHTPSATTTTSAPASAAVTDADPAPERDGSIPPAARAAQQHLATGAGAASARAALERYARAYVNWTASTVAATQRRLATMSLGQARAQALQAASSYARDRTLAASHVSNHGRLVSISQSLTTPDQWVLVTSETTTGSGDYAGLPAGLHVIYATVAQTSEGWVVNQWAPQN